MLDQRVGGRRLPIYADVDQAYEANSLQFESISPRLELLRNQQQVISDLSQ
jgi:hypothetical protein